MIFEFCSNQIQNEKIIKSLQFLIQSPYLCIYISYSSSPSYKMFTQFSFALATRQYQMKSEISTNFQKKIKDYVISYCPTQYYGKNIHGEIRSGYKLKENKIVIFRIVPLPITPAHSLFLQLQHHYSDLSGFARMVYQPLHSSSNHYIPLQFFPKTFHSENSLFQSNPKYLDEYVEKFLRVYSFFFNMRVTHGNLTAHNIGITFEGKVKLMDFKVSDENQDFQKRSLKDFVDFKYVIGFILEKDGHFPSKFSSFNSQQTSNWEHLFSNWHITSPLEPVYLPRKGYIDNIVTLLYKLYESVEESDQSANLKVSLRLLMMNYFQQSKQQEHQGELQTLEEIMGGFKNWDIDRYNGVLMGAIKDPQFYCLTSQQRLILISCLIPKLNHEYIYYEIVNQFNSNEKKRNQLLGDSLYTLYKYQMYKYLLKNKK